MRVLSVSSLCWPDLGGIEVMVETLLPGLRERHGMEVSALAGVGARTTAGIDERRGVHVQRLSFRGLRGDDAGSWLRLAHAVKQAIAAAAPDVLLLHSVAPMTWMAARAVRGSGLPIVYVDHGARADPQQELTVVGDASRVVAVSNAALQRVLHIAPGLRERATVIPNGIEVPVAPLVEPGDADELLVVGRLNEEKGVDVALRAVAILAVSRAGVLLTVAGDGPKRREWEALSGELGLHDRVRFTGPLDRMEVFEQIDRARVVMVPSRQLPTFTEAFCIVALEAALRGRPVVASAIDGVPETVVDGVTGLLVPPEDPAALAAAVATLLDDPTRARRLGQQACARALARFSPEVMIDAYAAQVQRAFAMRPI